MRIRPISISLNPNVEKDDLFLVLRLLFQPWKWRKGKEIEKLESKFKEYLGVRPVKSAESGAEQFNRVKYAISFNSGRSSFLAILKSLELKENSEVLLQAFTCNASSNPVLWARLRDDASARQASLKPVYVDVDESDFNIDVVDLKRKINSNSRVVVVQHTFGMPANMDEVVKICNDNNLILIEDCAHSLGSEYNNQKVGMFGKVAYFSFGRDKVISSVYGGMVVTNDDELAKKIRQAQKEFGYPSYFWIKQQLIHPILLNCIILPTYKYFGKYLFVLLQELHILSKAVHIKEKRGEMPNYFPACLPNALAILALSQFKKLEKFNDHRKEIDKLYRKELTGTNFELPKEFANRKSNCFRFTVKHKNAHTIIRKSWKQNILLGDWYTLPIAPGYSKLDIKKCLPAGRQVELKNTAELKDCPNAEKLSKITLNLPTHINISKKDAKTITDFLKENDN